ncbi:hypothetical protein ACVIDN_006847 [Rhizobium brockwellii]
MPPPPTYDIITAKTMVKSQRSSVKEVVRPYRLSELGIVLSGSGA